jgi:hypothetical protein
VDIRWNEGSNIWTFTNDGTNYYNLLGIQSLGAGEGLSNSGTTVDPILDVNLIIKLWKLLLIQYTLKLLVLTPHSLLMML